MEPKDYITIALSVLAFLLSVIATTRSMRNKKHDDERTLRTLMNDSVSKLRAIRTEQAKYNAENEGNKNAQFVNGLHNYQINSWHDWQFM
jgi:hypothetical protein